MLLGTVLVLLLLGGAGQASAHAALGGSDPVDGTVLKTAPRGITLTFTETVGLLDDSFRVLDPTNHRVRTGKAQHAAGRSDTVRVGLPAKLGEGTFTVAWRVVSADSHPVSGAFTFSVGKPSATAAVVPSGPAGDPVTENLYDSGRYAGYLAAALLIGTAVFVAVCRPVDVGPLRRLVRAGWWALAGSTVVLLVLRAPYESGSGPAEVLHPAGLARTLGGRPGLALVARLVLLAGAALLLVRAGRRQRLTRPDAVTGGALAVALALTWAGAEHASAGIQVPAAVTSSVLHLLAMAAWLGGLVALLVLLLRRGAVPVTVVTRFSRMAGGSVTVLVVTGVYQSWRGLGSLTALTETSYGRVLLAKLVAVVWLLVAGAWSRQWTRRSVMAEAEAQVSVASGERVSETVGGGPSAEAGAPETAETAKGASTAAGAPSEPVGSEMPEPSGMSSDAPPVTPAEEAHRRALRRSVLVEVVVSVVVLLLTTVLTGTLPGRAEAEAAAVEQTSGLPATSVAMVPFDVGTAEGRGKVQVTLDPGRVGDTAVEAVVYGPDGGLVAVPEVRISFTLPSQDIGPIDAKVADRGGYWATNAVNLPIPGTWTMKVTVRVSDIDQVTEEAKVRIAR